MNIWWVGINHVLLGNDKIGSYIGSNIGGYIGGYIGSNIGSYIGSNTNNAILSE